MGLDPEASDVETEEGSTRTEAIRYSEVSDVCPTDDENNSIGYTYEYPLRFTSTSRLSQGVDVLTLRPQELQHDLTAQERRPWLSSNEK